MHKRERLVSQPSFDITATLTTSTTVEITWKFQIINHGVRCTRFAIFLNPKNPIPSAEISNFTSDAKIEKIIKTEIELGAYQPFKVFYTDILGYKNTLVGVYLITAGKYGLYKIEFSYMTPEAAVPDIAQPLPDTTA